MNGKGLIFTVIAVGVSLGLGLGTLILTGHARIDRDIQSLQENVSDLSERMARLEGLFEGHLNRDADK